MSDLSNRLIDADKLTEPLVFCVISGGDNGWFNCDVRTTARSVEGARQTAASFLEQVFPGKRKIVRAVPEASEERDFEYACRIVKGYCRFAFRLEAGPTELSKAPDEPEYLGFGHVGGSL